MKIKEIKEDSDAASGDSIPEDDNDSQYEDVTGEDDEDEYDDYDDYDDDIAQDAEALFGGCGLFTRDDLELLSYYTDCFPQDPARAYIRDFPDGFGGDTMRHMAHLAVLRRWTARQQFGHYDSDTDSDEDPYGRYGFDDDDFYGYNFADVPTVERKSYAFENAVERLRDKLAASRLEKQINAEITNNNSGNKSTTTENVVGPNNEKNRKKRERKKQKKLKQQQQQPGQDGAAVGEGSTSVAPKTTDIANELTNDDEKAAMKSQPPLSYTHMASNTSKKSTATVQDINQDRVANPNQPQSEKDQFLKL